MAGHSHWAGIKHKKALVDSRRGKLWSKLARNIIMAARDGGGDPDGNLSLRYAIDKAKDANMPKDTIEKAIKKGTGDLEGAHYEEIVYEGYAIGGVAVMCEAVTDNRNRTAGELRKIFDSKGGSLGATGCVAWMFTKKGLFTLPDSAMEEEAAMEFALEHGAEDFQHTGDLYEITCPVEAFNDLKQAFEARELKPETAELSMIPSSTVTLDESAARKVLDMMETLEDHDDIQNVYANFDIPEEIMKSLEE